MNQLIVSPGSALLPASSSRLRQRRRNACLSFSRPRSRAVSPNPDQQRPHPQGLPCCSTAFCRPVLPAHTPTPDFLTLSIIWTRSRKLSRPSDSYRSCFKCDVPSHTQNDDLLVKVPALEQILCRGRFRHPGSYRRIPSLSTACTRTGGVTLDRPFACYWGGRAGMGNV
jgi:hypothetical protein